MTYLAIMIFQHLHQIPKTVPKSFHSSSHAQATKISSTYIQYQLSSPSSPEQILFDPNSYSQYYLQVIVLILQVNSYFLQFLKMHDQQLIVDKQEFHHVWNFQMLSNYPRIQGSFYNNNNQVIFGIVLSNRLKFFNNILTITSKIMLPIGSTSKKPSQSIYNKIAHNRELHQSPTFATSKKQIFHKDNLPYSQPLRILNNVNTSHPAKGQQGQCNSYRVTDARAHCIDSVVVDYKQKTFQLMRKNAQLELNIKQSRTDAENLENQVLQLTELIRQIFELIGNGQGMDNSQNSVFTNIQEEEQENEGGKSYMTSLAQIKHLLNNLSKKKDLSNNIMPITSMNLSSTQQPGLKNEQTQRYSYNNDKTRVNSHQGSHSNEVSCNCQCEDNFNEIIIEYKTMIEVLHTKIIKKEKINRTLKQQIQEYAKQIEEFVEKIGKYQAELRVKQEKIDELQQKIALKDQQILSKDKQYQEKLQQRISQIPQLESQLKEISQKYEQALRQLQEKDRSLEGLVNQNEELFKQKQKINKKYQQELVHFEDMSKLVQEKLIEVEYEINFYKKERTENFEKIRKLETELKEYKISQEKKYYSFGDSQKEVEIQVNEQELESEMQESYAEIIIQGSKSQAGSSNEDKIKTSGHKKRKISVDCKPIYQQQDQDSPRRLNKQTQNWQIQCYQQSIKTLLAQNNRLKDTLLKLYKYQKDKGNQLQISKQIELQLKILLTTMPNNEQQVCYGPKYETIKKQ